MNMNMTLAKKLQIKKNYVCICSGKKKVGIVSG